MTIGDEIFYTGLFWEVPGAEKNAPIVRIGNISAMPGEPIATEDGPAVVYLMEARSIGGLSGSPVFVDLGGRIRTVKGGPDPLGSEHEYYLIGVACGHWDIENKKSLGQSVNMGIAMVTPTSKVLEVLNRQELLTMRSKKEIDDAKKHFPKKDRVPLRKPVTGEPLVPLPETEALQHEMSKKEIEGALKKVIRKQKSDQ
jgi:hypothetical protein